jgi:DNA-binding winged helix-turn-helix (wHTH) protein/TolB-like protein/Tfp pilus assembly protein PilF
METLITKHFRFSEFELDRVKRLLLRDGEPISLNPKAFDLLYALIERRGEVLTKDELLDRVWPGQFVEEGNLKVQISALRKAFGERKNDHKYIVTVPGRGYSFVADLEKTASDEIVLESHRYSNFVVEKTESITNGELCAIEERPIEYRQPSSLTGALWRHRSLFALSLIAVLAVSALAYWFFPRGAATSRQFRSVAVMPFVNDSGNADLEYLSDGLTESLIGSLSRLPDLSVKARTSIARYKGKKINLQNVGAELSVESIVTGRLVQHGYELALYVEFVEPSSGNVIWKAEYHRRMNDIAALDKEISRDVALKLKTKLSGEDTAGLDRHQTNNSAAYELYLRGVSFGRTEVTLERLSKSIDCFERAVQLDPNYAGAYIEMAWSYMRLGLTYGYKSPQETFPKAREALIKAIAIDESFSATHNALATYYLHYEWNWPAAEREFERAVALDPENAGAFSDYGGYYDSIGRFDEALRIRGEARKLLPVAANITAQTCYSNYLSGRLDEAAECYRGVFELNPRQSWSHMGMGRIYLRMKQYSQAIAEMEKGVELLDRNARTVAVLGHAYAKAGRRDDANRILQELQTRSKREYVSPYYFSLLYAGLNDREKAFEYLEQAFAERQSQLIYLRVEPLFSELHSDPRFDSLVKKVGIPD